MLSKQGYPIPVAKRCTGCRALRPASQFHKCAALDDGLRPRCKTCRQADSARYYEENKGTISAANAARYARDPDKVKERVRRYQAANPEGLRRRQAKYLATPGGKEMMKAAQQRRRARKAGATTEHFTVEDIRQDWADHDLWSCFFCAGPAEPLHTDHFMPLARGGTHALSNLVPSCAGCNHAKTDKEPWTFLADSLARQGVDLNACLTWLDRARLRP